MVMRRRFSRRRKRSDEGAQEPIDPQWMTRIGESPGFTEASVEAAQPEDVADSFALVGRATAEGDGRIVAVSPTSGGDALLAGLVAASRVEGDSPEVSAFAPVWDDASRRRLGVVAGFQPTPRALVLTAQGAAAEPVVAEAAAQALFVEPEAISAQAASPAARGLFARALEAFRGLAAKHGGAIRGAGDAVELVIFARSVASLRTEGERVLLEMLEPSRSLVPLTESGVSDAMDRLEGSMRKRLNDRKVRDGEEGLRGRWLAPLEAAAGARFSRRWPFGGGAAGLDWVGVTAEGQRLVAAIREQFTLRELGPVLDAALRAEAWLPAALAPAGPPLGSDRPRLILAAGSFDGATQAVLGHLGLPVSCYEGTLGGEALTVKSELEGTPVPVPEPRRRPRRSAGEGRDEAGEQDGGRAGAAEGEDAEQGEAEGGSSRSGDGSRRRRSRGRRRRGGEPRPEGGEDAEESRPEGGRGRGRRPAAAAAAPLEDGEADGIDEFSLFDLGDEASDDGDGGAGRKRRSRGRRGRGRRPASDDNGDSGRERGAEASDDTDTAPGGSSDDDDVLQVDDDDLGLSPDAPDPDDHGEDLTYEDEEEEPLTELDKQRLARESRRRARVASAPVVAQDDDSPAEESMELPRGRAAILAHADRQSIAAAVLLARDLRQFEGIWVYPQEDLMTFFRGVATDLRDKAPIHVIGFEAKPARDAIEAAKLYRGRLVWFDHHDWAPEDLWALREAIGTDLARVEPGAGSSLPLVLPECQRRSRFSEKLVDLVTGRFTHHDFQRWGRTWWWRLGEISQKPGDRRSDLEMLLGGRPSDLAKEASHAPDPPAPAELAYVAERDFRLVHFAGLGMVVATLPPEVDLHLTSRIARERYDATLSLARTEGDEMFVLGADDVTGRRAVDLTGMLEHLDQKFPWVLPGSDADHVARFRVKDLETKPERLDEIVAEIGMGRSVLEG